MRSGRARLGSDVRSARKFDEAESCRKAQEQKYAVFLEERRFLLTVKKEEEQKLIELILTLCSGEIALYWTIQSSGKVNFLDTSFVNLAIGGIILLFISILLCLYEKKISSDAYEDMEKNLYRQIFEQFQHVNTYPAKIKQIYNFSLISFFFGSATLAFALLWGQVS